MCVQCMMEIIVTGDGLETRKKSERTICDRNKTKKNKSIREPKLIIHIQMYTVKTCKEQESEKKTHSRLSNISGALATKVIRTVLPSS